MTKTSKIGTLITAPPAAQEIMDSDLEATKKFLHEMRSTRGYGYETGPQFLTPGLVIRDGDEPIVDRTVPKILAHISERTGRAYELVKVVKFIWSTTTLMLVTIEAKECVAGSVRETFHAAYGGDEVLECFIKPDEDAPTECIPPPGFNTCPEYYLPPISPYGSESSIHGPAYYLPCDQELYPGMYLLIPGGWSSHRYCLG